jgi:hypothetical protein
MLELRPNCECCGRDLPPESRDALICSFECTWCVDCARTKLPGGLCPNCGGELLRRPIRPRRLPARFTLPVTGFILSGIMTIMISGISTLLALGPGAEFLARWPIAWLSSWVIAFPTVLVVLPIVRRIVARIVASP